MTSTLNRQAARRFEEVAELLHDQGASAHRVQLYRRAAGTLERLARPLDQVLRDDGFDGLCRLPGIGAGLARGLATLLSTGRLPVLERLRGEVDPEAVLRTVPGIGEALAHRLHHQLGIDSLEELAAAAADGRLERAGIGAKRLAGILESLQGRLGRVRTQAREAGTAVLPPIAEVLEVDREYRERARAGTLPRIAPRRLNPAHEAWLPVLHARRGDRHYTALYSNTAHAHRLGKTEDWVVIYFDAPGGEGQLTVITAEWGALAGQRIVRGREAECERHAQDAAAARVPVQPELLRAG